MTDAQFWIALIPLFALGGSAVAFVVKFYQDRSDRRYRRFFDLMEYIDSNRPIATKMAAIYELRRFPEHKDFIIRFCGPTRPHVTGPGAKLLIDEMDYTRTFLESLD